MPEIHGDEKYPNTYVSDAPVSPKKRFQLLDREYPDKRQDEFSVMEYLNPDFEKLAEYMDNLEVKSVLIGGFDKFDFYQKMTSLDVKYREIIETKIDRMFKELFKTNKELTAQNRRLQEENRSLSQLRSSVQAASRDSRVNSGAVFIENQELKKEITAGKQKMAELEKKLKERESSVPSQKTDRTTDEIAMVPRAATPPDEKAIEETRAKAETVSEHFRATCKTLSATEQDLDAETKFIHLNNMRSGSKTR